VSGSPHSLSVDQSTFNGDIRKGLCTGGSRVTLKSIAQNLTPADMKPVEIDRAINTRTESECS